MQLLNPTFTIQSSSTLPDKCSLLIEISMWGISYLLMDGTNNCIALICYHYPADTSFDNAAAYIKQSTEEQSLLQNKFEKVSIIYSYPTALLVPQHFINADHTKSMLELLYGDISDAYIRSDFNQAYSLYAVYTVPKQIDSVLSYLFTENNSRHQYSLLAGLTNHYRQLLFCIFGNGQFTVMVIKNGLMQVIHTYQFKVPEDIVYHLLQLCESFELPVNDSVLLLNGMIDETSNLYQELSKYFLQIQFGTLPDNFIYPEEINIYPAHYFSHLFQMAACV